jgi:hypothetical protein
MGESKDLSLVMEQLHSTQEKAKRASEALGARRNKTRTEE